MNRNSYVTTTDIEYDADFYDAIYHAIKQSLEKKVDVKLELGEELIVTLDQLQFAVYILDRQLFDEYLKPSYYEMTNKLGFNLI